MPSWPKSSHVKQVRINVFKKMRILAIFVECMVSGLIYHDV